LKKTPVARRKGAGYEAQINKFLQDLDGTFDLGGKYVLEKKENKDATEFILDQVSVCTSQNEHISYLINLGIRMTIIVI
jgi:hypothetical protein